MKEEILIVVKTYPNLSKKYKETVCVAGINKKGEWGVLNSFISIILL